MTARQIDKQIKQIEAAIKMFKSKIDTRKDMAPTDRDWETILLLNILIAASICLIC